MDESFLEVIPLTDLILERLRHTQGPDMLSTSAMRILQLFLQ
jgi:hypothetical protein